MARRKRSCERRKWRQSCLIHALDYLDISSCECGLSYVRKVQPIQDQKWNRPNVSHFGLAGLTALRHDGSNRDVDAYEDLVEKIMSVRSLSQSFGFGPFRLLLQQRLLLEGDRPLRLGSRALKMLEALVQNAGQVLSRETLLAKVWPGVVIDDAALRVHMAALRKVLGDGRDGRRFIVTVPQRGYSFVAPVTTLSPDPVSDPMSPRPRRNLPHVVGRMFGRDDLLVGLATELRQQRCVTLVGPGEIGKTTTALTLAARLLDVYSGGIYFVDLASLRDPTHVAQALATVLNVAAPLDHPTVQLVDALINQHTLIILEALPAARARCPSPSAAHASSR